MDMGKFTEKVSIPNGKTEEWQKHIIIATGARSRELPAIPQNDENIIGYRKTMTLERNNKKNWLVIGSRAISVGAYFYNTMGTEVVIVRHLDRILPVEDEEVSKQLERSFKKSGIKIFTNAEVKKVETKNKSVDVIIKTESNEEILNADIVLSAVGIKTNIENIGLEDVGIAVDNDKIMVNNFYQTNLPGYYAIGDVTRGQSLAHVASAEGILCVEKIAGHNLEPLDYGNVPGCTYCTPEVASVGMTEAQAKKRAMK